MKNFIKKILAFALLFCIINVVLADRGVVKKNKNKTVLNIITNSSTIRNSISFNSKSGLSYKGSLLTNTNTVENSILLNSVITYQKGNMTYIIPCKQNRVFADIKQGYTGMKLIIRSH